MRAARCGVYFIFSLLQFISFRFSLV